ncbi:fumarylacetoacetate hydrolase family protein [Hymenobacter caeli]|uniref:2-keto-4-pentenoate hydratase/2-oxohepta-3-ene-1,7-dioic acid hydratase in catechol pathway n=1 Tax=Hymenobacter caeli TaxID=2735894 RepID=A0ABX2FUF3_9BACT|nr:fumarylacetoacetate hydrolase family protein [Hymenobacter caeli]NRT20817.1 2-keto-4-pentenoate hydratase/2-oxohepta-3-ene-1,7-dioic acid hydratase in catechol pathway [Hymenobacter caeli]
MKFVTFQSAEHESRAGLLLDRGIVDLHQASQGQLPADMRGFIEGQDKFLPLLAELKLTEAAPTHQLADVRLLAPLPNPSSFRDYVAFERHLINATSRAGHTLAEEWYQMPIFYFSNHESIHGPGDEVARPKGCQRLDYELELACIIGKTARDVKAEDADEYIFGYAVLNDWSARDIQMPEMKVHLGPAKGKDFATSLGPWLVTKDELAAFATHNHRFDLRMTATVNGRLLSDGNYQTVHYTFGQMLERASKGVTLRPGAILGSGTVGWGCLLELGPETHRWLEPGDVVELEITGLGKLTNTIV